MSAGIRYTYTRGGVAGTCYAPTMLDAAEIVVGHPYVNLVKPSGTSDGLWCIEERVRTPDGLFQRRIVGTIARAA